MTEPPRDMTVAAGAGTVLTIVTAVVAVLAVGYALLRLIKHRDPVFLYFVIGGAIASLIEPIVDILGLIYMPEKGAHTLFTFFGRGMPLFNPISYTAAMGPLAYFVYRYFQRGITPSRALRAWGVIAVINFVNETPAVAFHIYTYYGNQPLNPWGFPLWVAFVDPLAAIIAGALLVKLRRPLEQTHCLWAAALLVPMGFGSGLGGTAWPVWLALNGTGLPAFVPLIAAIITLGLSLFAVWIVGTVLAHTAESAVAADNSIAAMANP